MRLILLAPEVPFKTALPSTVIVQPDKLLKLEEVPLVTEKLPPPTVVIFKLLKSKVPPVWEKEAHVSGLAVNTTVALPEWEMEGWVAADLGVKIWLVEAEVKLSVPVPGVKVANPENCPLPLDRCKVLLPKSKVPPVEAKLPTEWVSEDPKLRVPSVMVSGPAAERL